MEAGLAVGGAFLSAFLQVAFDRIASTRNFIEFFQGKQTLEFDEDTLYKLQITLNTISVVLEDAENKQAKSPAVRNWLDMLKHEVNQADDLLDELNTECLRLKLDYQQSDPDPGVRDTKISFNSEFIEELMPKLKKKTARLEIFVNQINVLGLQKCGPKENLPYREPSTSVVDKTQIFGRDDEKENIIKMVVSDEGGGSDVSVIPITGMGGIGKTTLAQLVYNDKRVTDHFPTRAWVCVSEEYDAFRVTKALLMELNSAIVDDNDDFNRLQVKLRDSVEGKYFLIILDDIWNENYIELHNLKNPLNHGSRGSKIIITTRSEKVALKMQNEPFYHMQPIAEDHSWSLFKSHAFDNGDHTSLPEFETVGREIVKKCKGLPLAIKTIAGALRQKRDINEWHGILSSDIWIAGGEILAALNLSYKYLPSHLKSCFAFCAVFPKDIPFHKKEVILMWMANDLVQPSIQKSMEQIGLDYFDELRSRSLFEVVNGDEYLMHDLVNDLSKYVSGNVCVRLQDYRHTDLIKGVQRETEIPREVLHFSYLTTREEPLSKFRALAEAKSLRTFLPIRKMYRLTTLFFSDILPRFRRMRALTLNAWYITIIPDSIGDLKHLRFINLSQTDIKNLPNAIGKCLNLQTLILAYCEALEELPEDMRLLINLQYLDVRSVSDAMIERMDCWLSTLKDLQNISIVVDKIHGSKLDRLGKLQLCPSLRITGLEAVTVAIAERAEVKNKNCIERLTLEWNGVAECSTDELIMFSKLQPHTNTKHISIKGYRGTTFSDWIGNSAFKNMVSVSLLDCENCFLLPPLGQLIALKKLCISGLSKITEVGTEFYGNSSSSKPFQSLEELSFRNMAEWKIWNTNLDDVEFPSLKELSIVDCPQLVGFIPFHATSLRKFEVIGLPNLQCSQEGLLPYNPSIQVAKITGCPSISLLPLSPVIKQLVIDDCKYLEYPTSASSNSCLEFLSMYDCGDSIEAIPLLSFSKLQYVEIDGWASPKLFKLFNGHHQNHAALQELQIFSCNDIVCFPEGGLPTPNLKLFVIRECKKLKSLPEQMATQLSSLSYLEIEECPDVECFPEGGLPHSLETLHIISCEKLMGCKSNWGLQGLPSLIYFCICGDKDRLFPEEGLLPRGLQGLFIGDCPNLEALNHRGLQHLTSLKSLSIRLNLESLDDKCLQHLTCLESLHIWGCPNLRYLPEGGLTPSLLKLHIRGCPELKASMERVKGENWPKVSHVPIITIDGQLIT